MVLPLPFIRFLPRSRPTVGKKKEGGGEGISPSRFCQRPASVGCTPVQKREGGGGRDRPGRELESPTLTSSPREVLRGGKKKKGRGGGKKKKRTGVHDEFGLHVVPSLVSLPVPREKKKGGKGGGKKGKASDFFG